MSIRSLALVSAVAFAAATATPGTARADTSTTLAYTFVATLVGTAVGAVVFPYAVPIVAPAVAGTYGTVASAVTGTAGVLAAGVGGFSTAVGGWIVREPRLTGAVAGMATGLGLGLVVFDQGEAAARARR